MEQEHNRAYDMIKFGKPLPNRTYKLRPGAYGVLTNRSLQILVVETRSGKIYLPGGGVRDKETVDETVVREFQEETGLVVSCRRQFAAAAQFVHCLDEPHGYEKVCSFFLVELAGQPRQEEGECRCTWLNPSEASDAVFEEAHKYAIDCSVS